MIRLMMMPFLLAAGLAIALPVGAADDPFPATPTSEAHMKAKAAYQNALTDCKLLDNPDRRQLCTNNVQKNYDLMVEEADERLQD